MGTGARAENVGRGRVRLSARITECKAGVQVHFDPYKEASLSQAEAALLFSTEDGALASTGGANTALPSKQFLAKPVSASDEQLNLPLVPSQDPIPGDLLYREAGAGLVAFCVEPETGQDIFCLTGQEGLVYLRRPNP